MVGGRTVVCLIWQGVDRGASQQEIFSMAVVNQFVQIELFICTGSASFSPPFEQNRAQTNICIFIAFISCK